MATVNRNIPEWAFSSFEERKVRSGDIFLANGLNWAILAYTGNRDESRECPLRSILLMRVYRDIYNEVGKYTIKYFPIQQTCTAYDNSHKILTGHSLAFVRQLILNCYGIVEGRKLLNLIDKAKKGEGGNNGRGQR